MTTLLRQTNLLVIGCALLMAGCSKKNQGIPASLQVSPAQDTIGATITITGSGFSTNPQDYVVMWNETTISSIITAASSSLTTTVPALTTRGHIILKNVKTDQEWETAEVFQTVPKFYPLSEAPSYTITIVAGSNSADTSDYQISFNGVLSFPTAIVNGALMVPVPPQAQSGPITVYFQHQPYTSINSFTVSPVGNVTNLTAVGGPKQFFQSPQGLAFDKNGTLYVADALAGVIDQVNVSNGSTGWYVGSNSNPSSTETTMANEGLEGVTNLAFDPSGNLYATDPTTGQLLKIGGDSVNPVYTVDPNAQQLRALYIDASSNIYIANTLGLQMIDPSGNIFTIYEYGPNAIAEAPSGNLYFAEGSNMFLFSNAGMGEVLGDQTGYADGTGMGALLGNVTSMVRDPNSGNIYFVDQGAHLVRMMTPQYVVSTIAGTPNVQGATNGVGILASFEGPNGIALDNSGNLYVSDGTGSASCIRKIVLQP